ncbi:MAG TPA: nuclear transport factor 2 family protein, partial [Methylomirabilota bacterium]|nr:nuclear transport factor 2 family protein [Methylomirabilota bacterium]
NWQIDVVLIDRSEAQLTIAKNILQLVKPQFQHLDIVPHYLDPMNLLNWEPQANSADCILFEHVLTENPFDVGSLLGKAFLALTGGGKIYIIERRREKEPIWNIIDQIVSELAIPASYGSGKIEPDDIAFGEPWQFPSLAHKEEISADYLVLQTGEQESPMTMVNQLQRIELVLRYFQAWENQSVDLLEKVFASNAKYYEKPDEPPIKDLAGIKAYWRENVLRQRNIRVKILHTSFSVKDASIDAEWEAKFVRSSCRVQLHGTLIMKVDLEQGRVVELREYYRSKKSWESDF